MSIIIFKAEIVFYSVRHGRYHIDIDQLGEKS